MTTTARTREDFFNGFRTFLQDAHSFRNAFLTSENSRHHLRLGMGTAHEMNLCENYTNGREDRFIGCLENALLNAYADDWVAGSRAHQQQYYGNATIRPIQIAKRIGFSLSLAKEQQIVDWTVTNRNLVGRKEFTDTLDTFANSLNDITITWRSGNGNIQIGTDQPFNMVNRDTARFDHTETLRLTNIIPADNSPTTFVLEFDVPAALGVQAKMTMHYNRFPVVDTVAEAEVQELRIGNNLSTALYLSMRRTVLTRGAGEVADRTYSHISVVFEAIPTTE